MKEKIKRTCKKLFEGELTIKKSELWLIGLVCLLFGIVYGLKKAPWTHGVSIASNNGNQSGCSNFGGCDCDKENCDCGEEGCCCDEENCDCNCEA